MLNDEASEHFLYRDFIIDRGETSGRVENLPQNPETWKSIASMAAMLDVVAERFGALEITYGFCSPARAKLVRKWGTYQKGDQHVGHELNRNGDPICPRLGFAVDFVVPGVSSARVAAFVAELERFDRIYFYGAERPLHVSIPPGGRERSNVVIDMERYPRCRPLTVADPLDFFSSRV